MTLLRIFSAGCLAILLFGGCRKNFDTTVEREIGTLPTINVESSLVGQVIDEQGNPVISAEVLVADKELLTNNEGLFFVAPQLLDANGTAVRVHASGYFSTVRFAFPHLGTTANIQIKLIPKKLTHTFSAAQGATFAVDAGAEVAIPANALQDADGQPYQGSVRAYAVWLDPTQAATFGQMPGDLRASDQNEQVRLLRTFGMLGVVLEGSNGRELNIRSGQQARIVLPIPEAIRKDAPATIPLWHFDETSGYWVEEGSAVRRQNRYEGTVSHFSFWNCDVPANYVKLSGTVVNKSNRPLTNIYVKIISPTLGERQGWLDEKGQFSGLVPANEVLQMEVHYNMKCSGVLYTAQIGPLTADTQLSPVKVSIAENEVTIRGTVTSCSGQPAAKNVVLFKFSSGQSALLMAITDANGQYEAKLLLCTDSAPMVLTAYNPDGSQQSDPKTINVVRNQTVDAGNSATCNAPDEYIMATIDGKTTKFTINPRVIRDGYLFFSASHVSLDSAECSVTTRDDYEPATKKSGLVYINMSYMENGVSYNYNSEYCSSGCNVDSGEVVFGNYATKPGEYYIGTVKNQILDRRRNILVPIDLKFHIRYK
jgi:hypothetical protein